MKKSVLFANAFGEFAPIIAFVSVSESIGFIEGLWSLIVVSAVTLALSWTLERRVPKFGLLAATTILTFGAASLIFDQPFFIIFKDTLYYLGFALTLIAGLFMNRLFLRSLFDDYFSMTEKGWRILTVRWIIFFLLLTIGNELARNMLTAVHWTLYKLVAVLATWVFAFYQFKLSRAERLPDANEWGVRMQIS